MTTELIRGVLKKIADDPQYREAVRRDPVGEFKKVGIDIHPDSLLDIDTYLPSPDSIKSELDELFATGCDWGGVCKPRSPGTWLKGL